MEGDGVVPAWAEVNYAIGVRRVELCQLFHEDLDWWEGELKRDFYDRRLVVRVLAPFETSHCG